MRMELSRSVEQIVPDRRFQSHENQRNLDRGVLEYLQRLQRLMRIPQTVDAVIVGVAPDQLGFQGVEDLPILVHCDQNRKRHAAHPAHPSTLVLQAMPGKS
jgi:hypothetical protein